MDPKVKLLRVFPLRNNIVPKNITIDNSVIIKNLIGSKEIKKILNIKGIIPPKLCNDIGKRNKLWELLFKMNRRVFKHSNAQFNYMIMTDGISCCLVFKREKVKKYCLKYIEKTRITKKMKEKNIVTIDPGYSDIIYCMSEKKAEAYKTHKKGNHFRYTQDQRRVESGLKKYRKRRLNLAKSVIEDGKTVSDLTNELKEYNSKVCTYEKIKEWITIKNIINKKLYPHYNNPIYRKMSFHTYTNTQRSEQKMIKNFKKKFGSESEVLVILGDFDKKENMRGKEPVINRKIKKLFVKAKFEIYKINEFRTSKLCNRCVKRKYYSCESDQNKGSGNNGTTTQNEKSIGEMENVKRYKKRKKSDERAHLISVWGLVGCINPECKLIANRDVNACENMMTIVKYIMSNGKRPPELERKLKS
jgi:hypothetical protein